MAECVAEVLAPISPQLRLNGVLLSFERRVRGGVSTSVGTRLVTEMVCQGANVRLRQRRNQSGDNEHNIKRNDIPLPVC